ADSRPIRPIDVSKKLITYKKGVLRFCPHLLHSPLISLGRRFFALVKIRAVHLKGKRFHSWFLVVGKKAGGKAHLVEPFKKLYGPFIRRYSVRNQGIIYIKNHAPVS